MRAVDAVAKTEAQNTMVSGLEAVAISAVRSARAGEIVSSPVSSPARIAMPSTGCGGGEGGEGEGDE